ncbi:hypothetical protein [Aliarcobacter butzleri]|uniref:hypothetical protein n=1 Tax=Aliarcobacter butzleri TaxID=28197 RepID=UPI0021B381A1|nr:hypothetical protein [Aliarcobacter butzleri]MCT7646424.1 hypothetical protein [Aliarcobacter butzleri]
MKKIVVGLIFCIFFGLNLFGSDVNLGIKFIKEDNFTKAKELFGKAYDLGLQEGCEGYAKLNKQ